MSKQSDAALRSALVPSAVSCGGKVALGSFSLAQAVVTRNGSKDRNGRSAYKCGHCGQYHIGTDNGKVGKKKALGFAARKLAFSL